MTEQEWLGCEGPEAMLAFLRGNASSRKLRLFACALCRLAWDRLTEVSPCGWCGGGGGFRTGYYSDPGEWIACGHCAGTGRVNRSHRAVEVAEQFADGRLDWEAVRVVERETIPEPTWSLPLLALAQQIEPSRVSAAATRIGVASAAQAALLRDLFGNVFRPYYEGPGETFRRWRTPDVRTLAETAYDARQADGFLDTTTLAILADALEETGCDNADILGHLRGCCAACGHSREAHSGHTRLVGMPEPTFCSQGCGCLAFVGGHHARGCWAVDLILGKT